MPKNIETEEHAAAVAEASPEPPRRAGDLRSLEALLKKLDKIDKLRADTEALKLTLEDEIDAALNTGEVLDEKLALALQTKRGQLELVPAKLAQFERQSETLMASMKAELALCLGDLQRRMTGVGAAFKENIIAFLRPLMVEDWMLPNIAETVFIHTKLDTQIGGIVSRVQYPFSFGDSRRAALELLGAEKQANTILESARIFTDMVAQAAAAVESLSREQKSKVSRNA